MAKKKKEDSSIIDTIKDFTIEILKLKSVTDGFTSLLTKKIKQNIDSIERNMVAGFILMLSFTFILISIIFLFKYFFKLDYGFTFLIIGLLLLISGIFYQNGGNK